ncbi:MAG: hypothetical protein R3E12_11035 [Candidatus Eisenbacteria bacterium]
MSRSPNSATPGAASPSASGPLLSWRFLALFALALVALRVLFLLATLDPSEERVMEVLDPAGLVWSDGPSRPLYDREELYTATAAAAMRHDLGVAPTTYQFMAYGGGSLVTSLLAIPVQGIFGASYLAFKLIPLCVTLLGALCWAHVAAWGFGIRAGTLFAALFLLAPSVFVRTMWIAKGDHSEAATWIGFVFLLAIGATRAHRALVRRRATLLAWLTGFAGGFGVFFTYSTVPVMGAVFAVALLRSRARPLRLWLWGAVGFAIGFLPWIVNLIRTRGGALRVYSRPLGASEGGAEAWERLQLLLSRGFLATYDLPESLRKGAAMVFVIAVLLGIVALVLHLRRGPDRTAESGRAAPGAHGPGAHSAAATWMLLAGIAAHLAAFCLTAPDRSSRYLMPLYPLLLLLIAAATQVRAPRTVGRAVVPFVALFLLGGAAAQLQAVRTGHFRALAAPLRGTDWPLLGEILGQKLAPDQIQAAPATIRQYLWIGLGTRVFRSVPRARWTEAIDLVPAEGRLGTLEGLGVAWGQSRTVLQAAAFLDSLPQPERRAIVRGIARYAEIPLVPFAFQNADGAQIVKQMADGETDLLDPARARVFATLDLHGYATAQIAGSGLTPDLMAYGDGFAAYGGIARGNPTLWFWTDAKHDPRNASRPTWNGVADAFARDLHTVPPRWVLENGESPRALARLLERCAVACNKTQASALYRAAGSAAAAAWQDPDLDPAVRAPERVALARGDPRIFPNVLRRGVGRRRSASLAGPGARSPRRVDPMASPFHARPLAQRARLDILPRPKDSSMRSTVSESRRRRSTHSAGVKRSKASPPSGWMAETPTPKRRTGCRVHT